MQPSLEGWIHPLIGKRKFMNATEAPMDAERSQRSDLPACFGDADVVCPRDEDGIMQPRVDCLRCEALKPCLQHALRKQGLIQDPPPPSPLVSKASSFLKRWSEKKLAQKSSREE
jgi:hypothetical protein